MEKERSTVRRKGKKLLRLNLISAAASKYNKKVNLFSMKTKVEYFMKTVHVLIFNSIADRCAESPVEFRHKFTYKRLYSRGLPRQL